MNRNFRQLALIVLLAVACVPTAGAAEPDQSGMNNNTPRADPKLGSKEPAYKNMNSNAAEARPALNSKDLKIKAEEKLGSKEAAAAPAGAGKPARAGVTAADLKKPDDEKSGSKEPAE